MSILSNIIAQLESGGGVNIAGQPASMVDPTFGQYPGFVNQYGGGAAGVDNYASQFLAANPNATLGDFYASYVLGTGNPAAPTSAATLQALYPSAYNNLVQNAGYPASTPLSELVGAGNANAGSTGQATAAGGSSASAPPGNGNPLANLFTPLEQWLTNVGGSVVFVIVGVVLIGGALIIFANAEGAGALVLGGKPPLDLGKAS